MLEEIAPVLPPGVADRFIELYIFVPLLLFGAAWFLYRIVVSLKFYIGHGSFSDDDTAMRWSDEDTGKPVGPVQNIFLDVVSILFLVAFAAIFVFRAS